MNQERGPQTNIFNGDTNPAETTSESLGQVLNRIVRERGITAISHLDDELDVQNNANKWVRDEVIPSPESMSGLLRTVVCRLPLSDEEHEALFSKYSDALQAGKGLIGVHAGTPAALALQSRTLKPAVSPLGQWIDKFILERRLTIQELSRVIGIHPKMLSRWRMEGMKTDAACIRLLNGISDNYLLDQETFDNLGVATAQQLLWQKEPSQE